MSVPANTSVVVWHEPHSQPLMQGQMVCLCQLLQGFEGAQMCISCMLYLSAECLWSCCAHRTIQLLPKASHDAPVTNTPASAIYHRTHQRSVAGVSKPGSVRRRAGWSGKNTSAAILISTFPCPTGIGQWGSIALTDITTRNHPATPAHGVVHGEKVIVWGGALGLLLRSCNETR